MTEEYRIEAEQSIIGSMLIEPRCIGTVMSQLRPDDFSPGHAPIVAAVLTLFSAQQPVDAVTVLAQMRRDGTYREPDTRNQVIGIVDVTPTAANVGEYIRIVAEAAKLRRVQQIAGALMRAQTLDEVPGHLDRLAASIHDQQRADVEDMATGITRLFSWLEDQSPVEFLPTSLETLDNQLMLEPGMYVILGGNPSDGKTLLAVQMAMEMARTRRVGFFSCETSLDKLLRRMVSSWASVSSRRLRRKNLRPDDYRMLAQMSGQLTALKLDRIHSPGYTVADIRATTAARGYEIIFVDYLQIVRPDNPRDPDVSQLQQISRQLHQMAQEMGVLVVCLSQYSWESAKQARTPRVSDLKGASEIEQNADVILLLSKAGLSKGGNSSYDWEDTVDPKSIPSGAELRLLQIGKNKDGERGGWLHLLLWGDLQRFQHCQPATEEEPPDFAQDALKDW